MPAAKRAAEPLAVSSWGPLYYVPTGYYSPLKSGFRFSPKALIPSSASLETKTRLIASRSMARPRSRGAPKPCVTASLA
jgi:hypothetical protein